MGPPYLDPPDGETQISEMGPTRVEFNKLSSLLNSTQKFEQSLRKETNLGKKLPTLKAKPKPSKLSVCLILRRLFFLCILISGVLFFGPC